MLLLEENDDGGVLGLGTSLFGLSPLPLPALPSLLSPPCSSTPQPLPPARCLLLDVPRDSFITAPTLPPLPLSPLLLSLHRRFHFWLESVDSVGDSRAVQLLADNGPNCEDSLTLVRLVPPSPPHHPRAVLRGVLRVVLFYLVLWRKGKAPNLRNKSLRNVPCCINFMCFQNCPSNP